MRKQHITSASLYKNPQWLLIKNKLHFMRCHKRKTELLVSHCGQAFTKLRFVAQDPQTRQVHSILYTGCKNCLKAILRKL